MKKRLFLLLCSFLAVYAVNFFIPRLMPGDPFRYTSATSGEDLEFAYSEQQLAQLRAYYGLDQPLGRQFVQSAKSLVRGNLGESIYYKKPVAEVLWQRLPWSLGIMTASLLCGLVLGAALALLCVRGGRPDAVLCGVFSVLAEVPSFFIAVLLLFLVAARVPWLPLSGGVTAFAVYPNAGARAADLALHALLPALALTLVTLPQFYFTARAEFLSVLQKPYLLAAKAKGLGEGRIRLRYILRNSLTALTARFFLSVGTAVSGTVLIENVFAYPGIGTALREAVSYRDYPMIQGVFLVSAVLVLLCVFVADTLNTRHEGGRTR